MGVFIFGRMNPPTKGHKALIEAAKNKRINKSVPVYVFVTATQRLPNNPLFVNEKKKILNAMFKNDPNVVIVPLQPNKTGITNAMRIMNEQHGVTPTILVLGQNRINKGSFKFVNQMGVRRVSGGNRNLSSTTSTGGQLNIKNISATKAREAAVKGGNFNRFMNTNKVPKSLLNETAQKIRNRTLSAPVKRSASASASRPAKRTKR